MSKETIKDFLKRKNKQTESSLSAFDIGRLTEWVEEYISQPSSPQSELTESGLKEQFFTLADRAIKEATGADVYGNKWLAEKLYEVAYNYFRPKQFELTDEMIKNILRNFGQFYGQMSWGNGRSGVKELPDDTKLIDVYSKEISTHFRSSEKEKASVKKDEFCQCREFKPMFMNSKICRICGAKKIK